MICVKIKYVIINMNDYILTDYQLNSVYKLINDKDKHGIILWWSMGSGKTIASITYIMNCKNNININIICPENIKFIWENDIKKFGIKNNIKYYTYEKLSTILKRNKLVGEIVIVDEAHNLIQNANNNIKKMITLLNTSEKVILLTGTPLYKDYMDIVYLVNIAAGKKIIPYNNCEFKKIYFSTDIFKKGIYGYYQPFIVNMAKIFEVSGIIMHLFDLNIFKNIKIPYILKNISNNVYKILEIFDINNYTTNIQSTLKSYNNPYLTVSVFILLFVNMYIYMTKNIFEYKLNEIKYINTDKLANVVEPYISVYKKPLYSDNFPYVNMETKYSPYNNYQLAMWIDLTQNELQLDTIKKLEITSKEDVEYYTNKISIEEYINKGVFIGNLNNGNIFSEKYYKILEISKGKKTVIYSSSLNNGINQIKQFFEFYKINYLYLDVGMNNYTINKIITNFKKNGTYLLLHPDYNEGISIYGTEQLHILEPVDNLSKKEQIISRVVRFDSHAHLPLDKRKVDVYQWICESKTILSKINKIIMSIRKWYNTKNEIFFTENYLKFNQNFTPDSILIYKLNKHKTINDEMIKSISEISKTEIIDCCINMPSNKQFSNCMKIYNKKC